MKLATFMWNGIESWGLVLPKEDGTEWVYEPEKCEKAFWNVCGMNGTNGYYMCLPEFMPDRKWPDTLMDFLKMGSEGMERLKRFETFLIRYMQQSDPYYVSCCGHPLSEVRLRSPIPRPRLFLGLVQNSPSFWRAQPERIHSNFLPQAHQRPSTSVVGSGEIYLGTPGGNVELGIVIGRDCYHVPVERAYDCIAGYVVVYDSQVNTYYENFDPEAGNWRTELLKNYPDWFADATGSWIGKGADSHCICGPYLTTKDEIGNPYDLLVWTETNHQRRDRSSTAGYSLGVERTVHFFSQFMHLHPGDIIHMGTVGTDGIYVDMEQMPFDACGAVGGEIERCGKVWAHVHYPEKLGDTRSDEMKKIPLVPAASDFIDAEGAEITEYTPSKSGSVWTCYGNFHSCMETLGWKKAPSPRMLNGPASQIAENDSDDLILSPIAQDLDISAEIAVIISRVGKKIDSSEAQDYILGYAAVLSVCDRSIRNQIIEPATPQEREIGLVYGRWGDGYNVLGPVKKLSDISGRKIILSAEGIGRAEGNTDEYVCSPARCLEFLSIDTTVLAGDVILLGRVGQIIHVEKEDYRNGLRVTAEIEGIGSVSRIIRPFTTEQ